MRKFRYNQKRAMKLPSARRRASARQVGYVIGLSKKDPSLFEDVLASIRPILGRQDLWKMLAGEAGFIIDCMLGKIQPIPPRKAPPEPRMPVADRRNLQATTGGVSDERLV